MCPAMTMPTHCRRVVGDLVSGRQDAYKHLMVASRSRRRASIESLIEGTHQIDGHAPGGHFCPRADAPPFHRIGVLSVEDSTAKPASEWREILEELLGVGFEFNRQR